MRDVRREYMRAMRELWGGAHWITWQPNIRLRLGDIGAIDRGELILIDNLASRGIPFSAVAEKGGDELVYDSNGKATVSIKLSGQVDVAFGSLMLTDAGAKVSFGNEATSS